MFVSTLNTASVFVTSYAIGNTQGFAIGKWFDLTDYSDKEEFYQEATEYVEEVLGDTDPELCFSDYETGFTNNGLITEGGISAEVWEILELTEDDLELVQAYRSAIGTDVSGNSIHEQLDEARNKYVGQWEDKSVFGYERMEQQIDLDSLPNEILGSIDWHKVGEELSWDYSVHEGYYFHT